MFHRFGSGARAGAVALGVVLAVVATGLTVPRLVNGSDTGDSASPARPVCQLPPTDGEAAVTAAIARCPDGTTVRFPRDAVYHQSAAIKVERRADLTIDGNGSSFVSTAANDGQFNPNWMIIDSSNVTLHNMDVEGNFKMGGPRSLERMQQTFPSGNHFNAGVTVYGGDGVTVRDLTISDTFGDGALAGPSGILPGGAGPHVGIPRNIRFQRLTITRTARQGVAVTGGVGIWLEDSRIVDSWYLGVDLEIDVPGQLLQDVHILRNTFDGTFFGAIALPWPGDGRGVDGIEIRANRTLRPPDGCGAQISVNATPGQTEPVANVVIEENRLLTQSRGISYANVTSGTIRGNHVEKRASQPCGDPGEGPVVASASPAVIVDRNTAVNF